MANALLRSLVWNIREMFNEHIEVADRRASQNPPYHAPGFYTACMMQHEYWPH